VTRTQDWELGLENAPKFLKGRRELGGRACTAEWKLAEGEVRVDIVDFGLVEGLWLRV
jgi:hypothetical protein